MIMNPATWVLVMVALVCIGIALFVTKNPIARRNYFITGGLLLAFATIVAIIQNLSVM